MNTIPSGLVKNANPKNTPLHKNPAPPCLFSKENVNADEPAKIKIQIKQSLNLPESKQ